MSNINLHISSNFLKLLCIGKRCFQPSVAKLSQIMYFIHWAPMLVQIFSWTGVPDYQKFHLLAPVTADKFLIEKHMIKLIWRNLWMILYGMSRDQPRISTFGDHKSQLFLLSGSHLKIPWFYYFFHHSQYGFVFQNVYWFWVIFIVLVQGVPWPLTMKDYFYYFLRQFLAAKCFFTSMNSLIIT